MNERNVFDFVSLGFCSNDDLCVLPFIPLDAKVRMLEHTVQGGGPAATSAVTAARLGLSTAFVGITGDDEAGSRIRADLEAEGVSTSAMKIRKGEKSPVAYCWIDKPTGQRSVAWTSGTLPELRADEVDPELIRRAKALHIDGHNPAAALAAASEAHAHGIPVSFDAGTMRDGVPELFPFTTLLIASELFAKQYAGTDDPEQAIFRLAETKAPVVGITLGAKGSIVLDRGTVLHCPAFHVDPVVDTTGAGDVYHAAFCVRYLETRDLMECMRFASAVSALKCRKLGGRAGIPLRAEVDRFLKEQSSTAV